MMFHVRPLKPKRNLRFVKLYIFPFFLMFLIYTLTSLLTATSLQYHLSSSLMKQTNIHVPTEYFVDLLAAEMTSMESPHLTNKKIQSLIFELATNVKIRDNRSLLGREIPGLSIYNTEIAVAGRGTNLTTLPVESPPPSPDQLEETEAAIPNQSDASQKSNEGTAPADPDAVKNSVLIYHSHSWEAFNPLLNLTKSSQDPASTNIQDNVIGLGEILKTELEAKGIGVEHDETNASAELKKKNWNYYQSYKLSREVIADAMASDKNLKYFIDVHRDSLGKELTTALIDKQSFARLFFIVGKENQQYDKNLQLAKKLNEALESKYPGISRGIFVKGKSEGDGVYNQDLSDRAMLIEFGGVDSNLSELKNSAKAFADVFSQYYWKAEEVSTQ
ncbi:stage II sporulation protein P [Falsibacillus albus]|uniref:Stage II sporulation protein P n=1 Tax=Falsibacillus albus TaxID=2478915 RepID=A0A3L7JZ87_9BACI|nr:stage II sporulation protein P [Falsibacillus albus]RLQ96198.1 stage II sporulation protein P [Falsibacillus albus]